MEIKLTGKTRHRIHKPLFGKSMMVAQVEVSRKGWARDMEPSGYMSSSWVEDSYWRDMRVEDMLGKELDG